MIINSDEIKFIDTSLGDETGRVFIWENRVFRAIRNDSSERVKELFSCGLLYELISKKMFPESTITEYEIENYSLIIEHNKISFVTYPYEWSWSMLKDAASLIIEINIVCMKYGYQTKDCHSYNILFDGSRPKFVDLGSFVKRNNKDSGWNAYEQFLQYYYYPLKIWGNGNMFIAKAVLSELYEMPHYEYWYYKFPVIRFFKVAKIRRIIELCFKLRKISVIARRENYNTKKYAGFLKMAVLFDKLKILPFQKIDFYKIQNKLAKLTNSKCGDTRWSAYHNAYKDSAGNIIPSERFKFVIDLISKYPVYSVVELACNQGILSILLSRLPQIKKIIATDYDANAVNVLYNFCCKNKNDYYSKITPAVMNCFYPEIVGLCIRPEIRFKSDVVISLALTHHLILRQNIPIEYIFKTFALYTDKYIITEFMPLGMYDGSERSKKVKLPEWYNIEWFRNAFKKYFNLVIEEKLEINRILFFGEKI
ncbi:hypothetical protein KA977_06245 [Candidatus Dependentiae bacterium]|nr:hypothetical protein [Candidatus Dependentiae bacterium]